MNKKEIINKVKEATVAVGLKNLANKTYPFRIVGSGFCIDQTGIIVTCNHVIKNLSIPKIQEAFENKSDVEMTPLNENMRPHVLFYDIKNKDCLDVVYTPIAHYIGKNDKDIGLIKVFGHERYRNGFPFLEVEEYENIYEGCKIGICGFPTGEYIFEMIGSMTSSFAEGIVSSIIPSQGVELKFLKGFQLDITATHGNSGGPVFELNSGKVFGIISEGLPDPTNRRKLIPGIIKAEPVYAILDIISYVRNLPYSVI